MTREENKRNKIEKAEIALAVLAVGILIGAMVSFSGEHFKSVLAVIGAVAVTGQFIKLVMWLEGER